MRFQTTKACHFALVIALGIPGAIGVRALDAGKPDQPTTEAPRLVRYTAKALDGQGKPLQGSVEIHFALYQGRADQKPIWSENQKAQVDVQGKYSVQLGSATKGGLPVEFFSTGEARWLGVQVNGLSESSRVRLLSVPYAITAADAQSLGGLPASAYMRVAQGGSIAGSLLPGSYFPVSANQTVAPALSPSSAFPVTTSGSGPLFPVTPPMVLFNGSSSIAFADLTDTGTNVGIGTATPASKLDVKGTGAFRGPLSANSTPATASTGVNSPLVTLTASAFNSATGVAADQSFSMRSTVTGNDTATPSAKMDTLAGNAFTGFSVSNKGIVTFAAGQNIPGGLTFKAPSSDFVVTGSPIASGKLGLNWIVPPSQGPSPNSIVEYDTNSGSITANTMTATNVQISQSAAEVNPISGTLDGFGFVSNQLPGQTPAIVFNDHEGPEGSVAVSAQTWSPLGIPVIGTTAVAGYGIHGASSGQGVVGESWGDRDSQLTKYGPDGVDGLAHGAAGAGVAAINDGHGIALYATVTFVDYPLRTPGLAGSFQGNVEVSGNMAKGGGSFRIDHPLDPANKYLSHSFVESPDMMNIYNGNLTTNAEGEAVVELPDWFGDLNQDFRYDLTVIGQFAHAMVVKEIANNQFTIKTDKPEVKVSWQVTGIRHDAWAQAHRIPVEQIKNAEEQGKYLHPDLYGKGLESSISLLHQPGLLKKLTDPAAAHSKLAPLPPIRRRMQSAQ